MIPQTDNRPPPQFVEVALNLPLDKTYQYMVPDQLVGSIRSGNLVRVPIRKRWANGCVVALEGAAKVAAVKPLHSVLTPDFSIPQDLIELCHWMADYYFCSWGEALGCASMIGFNNLKEKKIRSLRVSQGGLARGRLTVKQRTVAETLAMRGYPALPAEELRSEFKLTTVTIKRWTEAGFFEEFTERVHRPDPYAPAGDQRDAALQLTPEQQKAFDPIARALDERRFEAFLLHGVTGSGKTEIYLQALAKCLEAGREAIVLVPEISLTPQTVSRFRKRFGAVVGVYHSRLSLGQKYDLWRQIACGEVRVLVGARSALFAPFPSLGLILLDEEHETSYKQSEAPRYHARDVALMRGQSHRAAVIMGSATPSLEAYYNARSGKWTYLELPSRVGTHPLPKVELVDMTEELREEGTQELFSRGLEAAVRARLERGQQVLLFLNRRGFNNFQCCLKCHSVLRCEHCDVAMTYHKPLDRLVCHYCDARRPLAAQC
ncbi:MAG: primosomal protein N', partial [bacterium]